MSKKNRNNGHDVNTPCMCGSGIKFKKCCKNKLDGYKQNKDGTWSCSHPGELLMSTFIRGDQPDKLIPAKICKRCKSLFVKKNEAGFDIGKKPTSGLGVQNTA